MQVIQVFVIDFMMYTVVHGCRVLETNYLWYFVIDDWLDFIETDC